MPNLLNDNLGMILRGQIVLGKATPDQQVSVDFTGAVIPNESNTQTIQSTFTTEL